MNFWEACRLALDSVRSNKMRSALTLLGIVIGVAAVIVMISMGQGAKTAVSKEVGSLGANLVWAQPNYENEEVRRGNFKQLKMSDAEAVARECPAIKTVAPEAFVSGTVKFQNNHFDASIAGTTASFVDMRSLNLAAGRFLSDLDVQLGRNVVVLGGDLADKVMGSTPPVGQKIKLRDTSFIVIGVMEKQKKGGFGDNSTGDTMAFIPITAHSRLTGSDDLPVIFAQAVDEAMVPAAKSQLESLLARRYGEGNKYRVDTQESTLKMFSNILNILTAVLGGVAGVSLLVGGIGVMNIMLVTVTERTREIGIRKALGGTYQDILQQFVVESIVLCAIGGFLGIALGVGGSALISAVTPVKPTVSFFTIMVAVVSTTLIGVGFGVFPASKAARLDPIEALRYE